MFSIGDFARRGLVPVRMLRHYDAIGLLRPAHVDPASGYRFYQAGPGAGEAPRDRERGTHAHRRRSGQAHHPGPGA